MQDQLDKASEELNRNSWQRLYLAIALNIVQVVMLLSLLSFVVDTNTRIVALEAKMDIRTADRYRLSDAMKDFARRDQQILELQMRIEAIEGPTNKTN